MRKLSFRMPDMIVRTWCAIDTSAGARQYHHYFASTLLPELRKLPVFVGGNLLSHELDSTILRPSPLCSPTF